MNLQLQYPIYMANNTITQDKLIREAMKESPVVALYLSIGINVLRQVVDQQTDDFIYNVFGRLFPVATIRQWVRHLDEQLNPEHPEETTK